MERVLRALEPLCLDQLDEDWVLGIYHSEFLEIPEFPAEYENNVGTTNTSIAFQKIIRSIDRWLEDEDESDEDKTWATLSPNIKHQNLLTVLAFYIDYGTKNVHTKEYRNNALLASRVYYKFMSISGFKAYHIYHAQLFTHSLGCLGYPKGLCERDEHCLNTRELTKEVNSLITELGPYVMDLRYVVEKLQLQPVDMNFEDILGNLVDITGGAIVNKLNIDKLELAKISQVIYEIIDVLLHGANGEPSPVAIRLLFKCLLPKLVAASVDSRNANNIVRASYVTYTGLLLTRYGKAAISGFTVLIQHLCYALEGLERAEVRQARVSLVVGLMSLLPRRSYKETINWILKLSTTAKVGHRHLALEILAQLLNNEPETEVPPPPRQSQKETDDTAPPAEDQQTQSEDKEDENAGENPGKEDNPEKSVPAAEDENSQDTASQGEECGEEDVAGLLMRRVHRAPLARIVRAVAARALDAASGLRARALLVLARARSAAAGRAPLLKALKEAELGAEGGAEGDEGGEGTAVAAAAARAAADERAVVRRAAAALLATLDDSAATPVLVSLCRDASIMVRSAAIAALGELAATKRDAESMDAFLAGPLRQLSDPETKVQEQVTSQVQGMVIERIRAYDAHSYEDPLPWAVVAAVARHDMRRYLQKACTIIAKNTTKISVRLVDVTSTHLASENKERHLQCLTVLASIARHVDYSDPTFVLDYFYKLDAEEECDSRLLSLTVQLLSEWSQWVVGEARTNLRAKLVSRLADKDACRIEVASLAAALDSTDLAWANELLQLFEARALTARGESLPAALLAAADLALIAPNPPKPALLTHALNALNKFGTGELSSLPMEAQSEAVGTLVAGAGRLCLRARDAAAAAAPALAAALAATTLPEPARVNALLALADICARYTCIVEPLLPRVCACLSRDAPSRLRAACSGALTRLLLAAYLRLNTPLYYRYCALLADPEPDVREPAEYYVTFCLAPDTIYQHYVDTILYYNMHHTETLTFDERQLIYDVMLQRMSLVQRLNVQVRLAREILGEAAERGETADAVPPPLAAATLDAITLLCGPRMKLPRKPTTAADAGDIDDLQERVTTNIVSHKMKRTVAEVVVPTVLRLYNTVRAQGGQLATYLVRLATDLLKDYKQEIEELIENDEELVERVRQFQENIGSEPSFGNTRNLVLSAPHEPDTPRHHRKRRAPPRTPAAAKRPLRV